MPICPPHFKKKDSVVYFTTKSLIQISKTDVDFLSEVAATEKKTARVLLHGTSDQILHEMIIVHFAGVYVRPHANTSFAKSFTVLDGEMVVVTFHEDGELRNTFRLGDLKSNLPFMFRLNSSVYHTILPSYPSVTFVETTLGPHHQTTFADFSPPPEQKESADLYLAWLQQQANESGLRKTP